ncbi:MAG TPA: tRNA (adenosine(37)-N6)-dimethylallyltransferase MiaA [Verrucomicrobiae bacterium]|nr:tRNA (adenosine(37)-N6)-dimethylallyltransferase MiaA [Verrucomicrobiae bacterium]
MSARPSPDPESQTPDPLYLAGPTAVGKSAVALALAEKLGGEIISVDSMQVYRGLDIGTAKPGATERARVPQHLIDVAELTEPFDAVKFVALAQRAVTEIQSRHRVPIFCGGTGLYFKAYLEGLGEAPPADAKLRAGLEATPLAELLRELEQRDPVTFASIDRENPRRVIRAIEVIRLTNKPFSAQRAEWKPSASASSLSSPTGGEGRGEEADTFLPTPRFFCLSRTNTDLHARINARVDEMFAAGLVEETRQLLNRGLEQNRTAMQAIGYRQVVEHLRGERSLPETIELVKTKTRQFAKRQMTWFRKHAKGKWIEQKPDSSMPDLVKLIVPDHEKRC